MCVRVLYYILYIYLYLKADEAASGESHRSMGILNNCLSSATAKTSGQDNQPFANNA